MKQLVELRLKLSLWLLATLDEDRIVTWVRSALPDAFGEALTAVKNPVDILSVRQEARIYGTEVLPPPPDPEAMNDARAEWAETALDAFAEVTGCDREDALVDLLCDLLHWCDRNGVYFQSELERAQRHYDAETLGDAS